MLEYFHLKGIIKEKKLLRVFFLVFFRQWGEIYDTLWMKTFDRQVKWEQVSWPITVDWSEIVYIYESSPVTDEEYPCERSNHDDIKRLLNRFSNACLTPNFLPYVWQCSRNMIVDNHKIVYKSSYSKHMVSWIRLYTEWFRYFVVLLCVSCCISVVLGHEVGKKKRQKKSIVFLCS